MVESLAARKALHLALLWAPQMVVSKDASMASKMVTSLIDMMEAQLVQSSELHLAAVLAGKMVVQLGISLGN